MIDAVVIVVVCFVLAHFSYSPYEWPRDAVLAAALPACLIFWRAAPVVIDPGVAWLVIAWFFVLVISTIFADSPKYALSHAMRHGGAIAIGMSVVGFRALVMAACVHAVYQIFTNCCGDWGRKSMDSKTPTPGGLAGNDNISAAFLLPCVFVACHTGDFIPAALIAFASGTTKCRGGMVGFGVAIATLIVLVGEYWALIFVAIFAVLSIKDVGASHLISLSHRIQFWRLLPQFFSPIHAIMGRGTDNLKLATAGVEERNHGDRLRLQRAHNDAVQFLFDGGVPLMLLYFAVMAYTAFLAYGAGHYLLVAAIVAMAVHGLVFHVLSASMSMVAFWIIAGNVGSGIAYPAPDILWLFASFTYFTWLPLWGVEMLHSYYLHRSVVSLNRHEFQAAHDYAAAAINGVHRADAMGLAMFASKIIKGELKVKGR